MTYHFYNYLKLIQTVNNNYHHIIELEELNILFDIAAAKSNDSNVKIEYDILAKICLKTRWNHYFNKYLEWGVEAILTKLEGKTREELEAMDITTIIPNSEAIKYDEK